MSRRVLGGRPLQGSSRPPSHPMGGTGAPGAGHAVTHTLLLSLPAKKYKKVTGKEIYSDTLESTAMLEKAKFPQDYFPEVRPRRAAGLFRAVVSQQSFWSSQFPQAVPPCLPVCSGTVFLGGRHPCGLS